MKLASTQEDVIHYPWTGMGDAPWDTKTYCRVLIQINKPPSKAGKQMDARLVRRDNLVM